MIEPIDSQRREYHPAYARYGVTKFIAENGEGHRGVILETSRDGTKAILFGITDEYAGVLVYVEEPDAQHWPVEKKQLGDLSEMIDKELSTYIDAEMAYLMRAEVV